MMEPSGATLDMGWGGRRREGGVGDAKGDVVVGLCSSGPLRDFFSDVPVVECFHLFGILAVN
jgi:hypothetical protein